MATVDQRFHEKLRARAEGRTPVLQQIAELPKGDSPEAVEARYRAKQAARLAPAPAAPAPAPAVDKPKAPADKAKPSQPGPDKPKG